MTDEHGTVNRYVNHACRCAECKLAYRKYQLARTAERKARGLTPDDPRHGTYSGYTNYGDRCLACKEANTLHAQEYRSRRANKKEEE